MIRIAIVDDENMVCGGIENIVFQLSKDNNIELETA
jgi:YesN/AraC family two-component response regulator